jgi:hypothetical protein
MNNSLPVPGQLWYDMQSLELKFFDGDDWITIKKMKPIKNDIEVNYAWKRKFSFIPHRCKLSGNIVWLKYGMRGEPYLDGILLNTKPIWHDEYEHLNWAIINDLSY